MGHRFAKPARAKLESTERAYRTSRARPPGDRLWPRKHSRSFCDVGHTMVIIVEVDEADEALAGEVEGDGEHVDDVARRRADLTA